MVTKREQFANDASSTLSGGITSVDTSLIVASASAFPTSGNFRVLIGNELILVTAVSGNTFTITRGLESTTAATHANGDTVSQIVTAGGVGQFMNDSVLFADQVPLYHSITDINGDAMVVSDFTWVNQGTATATDVDGCIYMTVQPSGDDLKLLEINNPTTPYTITFGVRPFLMNNESGIDGYAMFCPGWRDSSTGRLTTPSLLFRSNTLSYRWLKWNNITGYFGNQVSPFSVSITQDAWIRIIDDGTDHIWKGSGDGINWVTLGTASRTTWLATPDKVFFGLNAAGVQDAQIPGQYLTLFHLSIANSVL